jgi:phosphoenolpyruvate carboxykinase (ATP)
MSQQTLEAHGICRSGPIHWNLPVARLVEIAVQRSRGMLINRGALNVPTGARTGRSPRDKYIVAEPGSRERIWWGKVNAPMSPETYAALRADVLQYLQGRELFVVDAVAGADPRYALPIRAVTEKAWHSLFVRQLFRRPTAEQLAEFTPEWVILNACQFRADPAKYGLNSEAFIILDFASRTVLIGGTEYAGEMKKSIFSVLNYHLPQAGVLPMHCAANVGLAGDVALFFGLSGTGKTTLSADPHRGLIGDDEHGWSDTGVFNFEGGCYAKCIKMSPDREPLIWNAIRFGSVIENVVIDPVTREPDYNDASITENTRVAYPLDFIANAVPTGRAGHPQAVIFLAADAFGVLPPVARLTPAQAMYHFMSGYTAALGGTETNLGKDPVPTFSACFGAPFLPLYPTVYAELLAKKMREHRARCYLINSGWVGNPFGRGPRIPLPINRDNITQILDGTLDRAEFAPDPVFGFEVPRALPGVPAELLRAPYGAADAAEYERRARDLAGKFAANFAQYTAASAEIRAAGPRVS